MKIKWIKYLVLSVVFILLIALWGYVSDLVRSSYYRFENNIWYSVISIIMGLSIGLLFGLEHFIEEVKKEGEWKINYPKTILLGLPCLYFSLAGIWIYGSNQLMTSILSYPLVWFMRFGLDHVDVFQLGLGYTFITSFYKYNENNLLNTKS